MTKVAVNFVADGLSEAGCEVDVLDLAQESLPLVNTDSTLGLIITGLWPRGLRLLMSLF